MSRKTLIGAACLWAIAGLASPLAAGPDGKDATTADLARPAKKAAPPNILLITADDMDYGSLGVTGCTIPGITPNLDRLASEGMRFTHAHVTVAVCQPSRSVLMTGRYPYRNGAMGFEPIRPDVPTLQESLRAAGYLNGIFAKTSHLAPAGKFCWDTIVPAEDLGNGRDPTLYYRHAKEFFEKARAAGKPFFLMANSQDPHRPFAGAEPPSADRRQARPRRQKRTERTAVVEVSRTYRPDEVPVPCFLPDLPEIRKELAQYFASVHRCDETVGQILRALQESGLQENTLVMFISDNGMPFVFAKTNCYRFSTRTPWIVRWPGKVRPGSVDDRHFISSIDFMPTVLEAAGLPPVPGVDGRSFLPLLAGNPQEGRDELYTVFHQTSGKRDFPMRSMQDRRYHYIFNAWSDGNTVFVSESTGTPTFKAMQASAGTNAAIAARVRMLNYRVPEELYDTASDPCEQKNVIDDPKYNQDLERLRAAMLRVMESTKDPLLDAFRKQTRR